jgi:hypothetical protein
MILDIQTCPTCNSGVRVDERGAFCKDCQGFTANALECFIRFLPEEIYFRYTLAVKIKIYDRDFGALKYKTELNVKFVKASDFVVFAENFVYNSKESIMFI